MATRMWLRRGFAPRKVSAASCKVRTRSSHLPSYFNLFESRCHLFVDLVKIGPTREQ